MWLLVWCGNKNTHTSNPLTLWNAFVSVLGDTQSVQLGNTTTTTSIARHPGGQCPARPGLGVMETRTSCTGTITFVPVSKHSCKLILLSIDIYISLSLLSVCLSVCLPAWLPACLSVCLSVCLPAWVCLCAGVSVSVCRGECLGLDVYVCMVCVCVYVCAPGWVCMSVWRMGVYVCASG